MDASEKAGNES